MESLAIHGRSDALTSQVLDRLAAQVVNDGKTAAINQHRAVPMVRRRTLDGILIVCGLPKKVRGVARLGELLESVAIRLAFALDHAGSLRNTCKKSSVYNGSKKSVKS